MYRYVRVSFLVLSRFLCGGIATPRQNKMMDGPAICEETWAIDDGGQLPTTNDS